jgi:hypothetical protein
MPDPFSGGFGSTKQEVDILERGKARTGFPSRQKSEGLKEDKKGKKDKEPPARVGDLYKKGVELLKEHNYHLELVEGGDHVNHRILMPSEPPSVPGITYPTEFKPLQDIYKEEDWNKIDTLFRLVDQEVRTFWEPLFKPKAGDSDLLSFTLLKLKMDKMNRVKNIHQVLDYGHSFDPLGRISGSPVNHPRIWVPDKSWFHHSLKEVTMADVFTIFPEAEQEMLKLILGRVGVGRANHQPPGWDNPIDHTARMAGVIVGKDAGLGKSTLFNGLTAAMQKCGFVTHTFKSTEDRFGLKAAATSDICYKDDTSLRSLKQFLAAEETKILITNGLFQVEEKFQSSEQIWPKCVILVNSNDWNSKFSYDLDPGIIDRIKLISTYREYEVMKLRDQLTDCPSAGSPDLRPRAHLPYLANKLGVSVDALYLWCLRLATDEFWRIVNDTADPTINRLQVEVRYWTTRQRIRFKADVTQALVNGMVFAWMLRTGERFVPELTPQMLQECLDYFYFVGVDPSGLELMNKMKKSWEDAGRPSTHYYQGFREIRWESVKKAIESYVQTGAMSREPASKIIKDTIEQLVMRDGFKVGGEANYVVENWQNTRFACEELAVEGARFLLDLSAQDKKRLLNTDTSPEDSWITDKHYSPDRAEKYREKARTKLYAKEGVK